MLPVVIPLRMVIFQIIFLLTAIGLEAMILRWNLRLSYRISIRRAATINLAATCIGWMVFFVLEPMLPVTMQEQLISYVLFNQPFRAAPTMQLLPFWLVIIGVGAFFMTFLVKLQSLELLLYLVSDRPTPDPTPTTERQESQRQQRIRQARRPLRDRRTLSSGATTQLSLGRRRANAVLQANAFSFTVILLLLVLRSLLEQVVI